MVESVEEELELMMELSEGPPALSAEAFHRPIEQLFSKDALCVDVSVTVGEAVALMREKRYGAIVVTRDGKLDGIFTERDLLVKVVGVIPDFESAPITDVMTPDPSALRQEDPIVHVAQHMHRGGYRHVPIVDEQDVPVSIVSIKDVMRYIVNCFPPSVINVPLEPHRGVAQRDGG